MAVLIPVAGPFPDVPDHIEQPEAVRWVMCDGRCPLEAVSAAIVPRELALPDVGLVPAFRFEFIAPGEFAIRTAAPSRIFPLRFGRQALSGPAGICTRIVICDVHDRMVHDLGNAALGTVRMSPVGAELEVPPL